MITPTQLMDNVVHSAVIAQKKLEGSLTAEYMLSERPVDGTIYSFRSISFETEFMLQESQNRKFLLFFRSAGQTTRLIHKLNFDLRSEPSPPVPPFQSAGASRNLHLGLPLFMLSLSEDRAVRQATKDAMENARWTARLDASRTQVLSAAKGLLKDFIKDSGCLAFRLDRDGSQFLVVSVTKNGGPDGIYLYLPGIDSVIIFSLPSVPQDQIEYQPMHQFAMVLYESLFGAVPNQQVVQLEDSTGIISGLDIFVDQLNQSYGKARSSLATSGLTPSPIPSYLEIGPLKAAIRYSTSFDAKSQTLRTSMILRHGISTLAAVADDDIRAVGGMAEIVITPNGADQETRVVIGMPSFVVSGANLDIFVKLARSKAKEIASKFADDSFPVQTYIDAISSRQDVVALHSFDNDKPDGHLLTLWPGIGNAAGLHFVFKCRIDSKAQSMDSVSKVLALGQDLADAKLTISDHQYAPFHNVFHSILLWSAALRDK